MSGTKPWLVLDSLEDVARQLIEQGGSCSVMVDFRNYNSSSPLGYCVQKNSGRRPRLCCSAIAKFIGPFRGDAVSRVNLICNEPIGHGSN